MQEMSFLQHLNELRKHLFRIVIAIVIGALIIGYNIEFVFDEIIFAPTKANFPTFTFFNNLAEFLGSDSRIIMPEKFPIQVRKMFDQINMAITVSTYGGIILAFPYIIYEIWKFIYPALNPNERNKSLLFVFSISFFFLLGISIGYFLITPLSIQFGYFFKLSGSLQMNIDLSNYIDLIINSCLAMGIVFLFPIVAYFLTSIGILEPSFLTEYRKHAIVVILIVSAIITPPDAVTMLITSIPLLLLYEFSVLICKITYKKVNLENGLIKVN